MIDLNVCQFTGVYGTGSMSSICSESEKAVIWSERANQSARVWPGDCLSKPVRANQSQTR